MLSACASRFFAARWHLVRQDGAGPLFLKEEWVSETVFQIRPYPVCYLLLLLSYFLCFNYVTLFGFKQTLWEILKVMLTKWHFI